MDLVQKWPFFQLFFLRNIGQENVFFNILERKNAILGYKNKKFKTSKNWHFSNGVNPWFWSNDGHFPTFFFTQYRQGKVLYYILKRRNAFLGYKNFSKVVNPWFGSKNGNFFPLFFLGNIGQKNVYYDIPLRKNGFLLYKNKKFNKSKNWHFSKVVNPWFGSKNGNFSNFFF